MIVNHYGRTVDSEKPVTGVFNNNRLEWIFEDAIYGINLDFEQHLEECDAEKHDECYEDNEPTYLIGFNKDAENKWYPDKTKEYSAIVNTDTNTTQVVHSQYLIKGALCSPCYPGQVDADTPGDFLAYAVPPDVVGDENPELQERIFEK